MISGQQNQNKSTGGEPFVLENGADLLLESSALFTLESEGAGFNFIGQRKSGIYFWGDSIATWGDSVAVWGSRTVTGTNQSRNALASKTNQTKN